MEKAYFNTDKEKADEDKKGEGIMIGQKMHSLFSEEIKIWRHRFFLGNLSGEDSELHEILNKLRTAGRYDKLTIRINSEGGNYHQMQPIINVCKDKFYKKTVTVNEDKAFSAAALIFLICGHERIILSHFPDYVSSL